MSEGTQSDFDDHEMLNLGNNHHDVEMSDENVQTKEDEIKVESQIFTMHLPIIGKVPMSK